MNKCIKVNELKNTEYRIYIKLFLLCVIKAQGTIQTQIEQRLVQQNWQNEENNPKNETLWNLQVYKTKFVWAKGGSMSPTHRTNSRENGNFEQKGSIYTKELSEWRKGVSILPRPLATRRMTERFSRMWRF